MPPGGISVVLMFEGVPGLLRFSFFLLIFQECHVCDNIFFPGDQQSLWPMVKHVSGRVTQTLRALRNSFQSWLLFRFCSVELVLFMEGVI